MKKVCGYVELNNGGMNLVNTLSPGPFPIIDVDTNFGVEILDHQGVGHWIMKANYTVLDPHTIHAEQYQEYVGETIKTKRGQNGHVHDVQSKIEHAKDLVAIQGTNGNWDRNDYMCGMYNGMELILATMEGRTPIYRTPVDNTDKGAEIDGRTV